MLVNRRNPRPRPGRFMDNLVAGAPVGECCRDTPRTGVRHREVRVVTVTGCYSGAVDRAVRGAGGRGAVVHVHGHPVMNLVRPASIARRGVAVLESPHVEQLGRSRGGCSHQGHGDHQHRNYCTQHRGDRNTRWGTGRRLTFRPLVVQRHGGRFGTCGHPVEVM